VAREEVRIKKVPLVDHFGVAQSPESPFSRTKLIIKGAYSVARIIFENFSRFPPSAHNSLFAKYLHQANFPARQKDRFTFTFDFAVRSPEHIWLSVSIRNAAPV
jgi:hypothetical protein